MKENERPEKLYRLREVLQLIPVSKSAWWAGVQSGKFPKPVKLGQRTTCWCESDLRSLIEVLKRGLSDG